MLTHHFELLPIKSTAKIRNKPIPPLQLLLHYLTLSNKCNKNESKCNKIIIKASCSDPAACLASDYPSQARIRPRKAACGDPPPVEQATIPPKRESVSAKPLAATTRRLSKRPTRLSPLVARLLFRLCCSSREKSLAPTEALSSVLISVISPSHRVQNRGLPVSPFPRMAC